jgi:WD40 repeat protein
MPSVLQPAHNQLFPPFLKTVFHALVCWQVCWNLNGTWLASCSRDFTVKVWDVRHTKREMTSWQAHQGGKDITAVAWHPVHLDLLASSEY